MDFCIHACPTDYGAYDCDLNFPSDDCETCPYCLSYDDYWGNMADFDYDFLMIMH